MDTVLLNGFANVNILLNLDAGTQIPFFPPPSSIPHPRRPDDLIYQTRTITIIAQLRRGAL
jgi:hypothetical protein